MRVAIAGATGFIGNTLVKSNLSLGHEVNILTRNTELYFHGAKVFKFSEDFQNYSELELFFENIDIFYNCLGETVNESLMQKVNVEYTKLFISLCLKQNVKKWVQLSSVGAYGLIDRGIIDEETNENPINLYEKTKTEADRLVKESGLSYVILRPSIVFGKKMRNQSIFKLIRAISHKSFFYIGKRGAILNYVHVEDVVKALILCGQSVKSHGKIYILSQNIYLEELVENILKKIDKRRSFIRLPKSLVKVVAFLISFYKYAPITFSRINALTSFSKYDSNKIRNELKFNFNDSLISQLISLIDKK